MTMARPPAAAARSKTGTLARALEGRKEISITVTGRRTGKAIRLPVWFVAEGDALSLLPIKGSQSHWFRNLRANPTITIQAGRQRLIGRGRPITDKRLVRSVVRKFQAKYTPSEVAHYYSRFDAAIRVPLKV
jgi:deazaflavin-dependent oxidoreductase (nitroreductase family)